MAGKAQVVLDGESAFGATVDTNIVTITNADGGHAENIDGGTTVSLSVGTTTQGSDQSPNNGLYVAGTGAWTRTDDGNTWDELTSAFVFVEEGTVNADTGWLCVVDAGGTLGTSDIQWVQFSQAGTIIGANIGGGIGLYKDKVGTTLNFRTIDAGAVYGTSPEDIQVSESADLLSFKLSATGVTANSYGAAGSSLSVTVDDYGRLSAVSAQSISITATQVQNFTEEVQDRIGNNLLDTNSIDMVYDDTPGQISANVKYPSTGTSIETTSDGGGGIRLSGDSATPGNYYFYSTNGSGTKGWNTITAASITGFDESAQDAVGGILTDTATIDFTYTDGSNTIEAAVIPAGIDHDTLGNVVANEHIDHTSVVLSVQDGIQIVGGGSSHNIATSFGIELTDTGVSAATYGDADTVAQITIDAQGRITNATDVDIQLAISNVTNLQDELDSRRGRHGFDDQDDIIITYSAATRILTVTPSGANFVYYIGADSSKHTIGSALTTTAHADTTGSYFVTIDNSETLTVSTTPFDLLDKAVTPVAYVYYNSTDVDAVTLFEGHHACRNIFTHNYLHHVIGTWKKGIADFAIFGYTLDDGSTAGAQTFGITNGILLDEDIEWAIAQLADDGPYTLSRRDGTDDWTWAEGETYPYYIDTDIIQWNEDSTGYTLSDVTDQYYVNYYVLALTAIETNNRIMVLAGQAQHATLSDAQSETVQDLSYTNIPFAEVAALYKVIYQRDDAGSTLPGNVILKGVEQLSPFGSGTVGSGGGGGGVHNALSGRSEADAHPTSAITNFAEDVRDTIAAFVTDTDTVAWTHGDVLNTLEADVQTQMSITSDSSGLLLSGDETSPGNNHLYGTNGSGTKGWYANTEIGYTRKYATSVGNGALTTFTLTHNLGSTDVLVQTYDNTSPYPKVEPDIEIVDTNNVKISFNVAPSTDEYRVIVVG
jgi:hypothetical protein